MSLTIIHLIPGLYLGGSEKVLELIANHQSQAGHKVHVIAFEQSGYEKFFLELDVHYCSVEYRDSLFGKTQIHIEEYERLIDTLKPDYIHSYAYWTDLISHYNIRNNITYISHFHLCYKDFDNFNLFRMTKQSIFRFIDKKRLLLEYKKRNCILLTASTFINDFMTERLPPLLRKKLYCLTNPIDDKYFRCSSKEKQYDLLTIGRLEEVKDHKFLLFVVKAIKDMGVRLSLAIVGEGPLKNDLKDLALSLGIVDQVIFVGIVKDLTDVFAVSNIYVHASKSETFGLSIFEAMAAGVPVIVRKFEGIDVHLLNNKNAVIVNDSDVYSFMQEVLLLTNSESSRKRLSVVGKKSVEHLSSGAYLKKLDLHYDENFSSI